MRERACGCASQCAGERAGARVGVRVSAQVSEQVSEAYERTCLCASDRASHGRPRSLTFKGQFWKNKALFFSNCPLKVSERGGAQAHVHTHASLTRSLARSLTRTLTRTPARSPAHWPAHPRAHPRTHMRTRALTRAHLGRSLFAYFLQRPPQKCFK